MIFIVQILQIYLATLVHYLFLNRLTESQLDLNILKLQAQTLRLFTIILCFVAYVNSVVCVCSVLGYALAIVLQTPRKQNLEVVVFFGTFLNQLIQRSGYRLYVSALRLHIT